MKRYAQNAPVQKLASSPPAQTSAESAFAGPRSPRPQDRIARFWTSRLRLREKAEKFRCRKRFPSRSLEKGWVLLTSCLNRRLLVQRIVFRRPRQLEW